MSLLDYLKAAAGEVSLFSAVGRWMQAVSQSLDQVSGSGLSAPDYGEAKMVTPQTINGTTNLRLDGVGLVRGIAYDPSIGTWTLNAGSTYLLRGHGYADTWGSAADGMKIQWVDDNNVVLQNSIDCPPAQIIPPNSSGNNSIEPTTEFLYTAPAVLSGRRVKLRVTNLSGSCRIPGSAFTAIVQQIPG